MKTMINWTATKEEFKAMARIAHRACALNPDYNYQTCLMDLNATHSNGMPLDLERLEAFPDFDFAHDVFGIANHIDRDTGKLTRCFVPRCAKRKVIQQPKNLYLADQE